MILYALICFVYFLFEYTIEIIAYAIENIIMISIILVISLVKILSNGCCETMLTKITVIKKPTIAIKLFFKSPDNLYITINLRNNFYYKF